MASSHAGRTSRAFFPPDMQDGTLEIEVKYASGLKNTDLLKNADPYCTIDIEGRFFSTPVMWGAGKNPIWNYAPGPVTILKTTQLVRFTIKDKDRFTEDDIMGYATLDLAEVRQRNFVSVQLPVKRPSGKEKGILAVNARYTPPVQSTLESLDSIDLPEPPSRPSFRPSGRVLDTSLGRSGLRHTKNFNVGAGTDIDPDEVMLRESRKVLSQFSTELQDVESEVRRLQKERKDMLPSDPRVSIVQYIMDHPDEFMELDDRLKSQLQRQATLKYGISELTGMEQLVKEHRLVEPEVVQPLQQFILTGVTREVARLGDDNTQPESMVSQVKQALRNQKMGLETADSLRRIDIWKDMLQDLFKQRAQMAVSASPHGSAASGGKDEDMRFRSNLWGKAKTAAATPAAPPAPMAISDSKVQQRIMNDLEAIISMLGKPGTLTPIHTSLPDDVPPPPPPDYEEPPSPPPPPPDDDEPPPPPPDDPYYGFPPPPSPADDPYYGNQTAAPPAPPPLPQGRNTVLEGEALGPKAPPPPPPLGMPFPPKKPADNGVMRTAEVSDLYLELTTAVMGKAPKKKVVAAGGNKSDLIAELQRKSPFHNEVKSEIQQYGHLIEKLAKEISAFTCSDMESAVLFMRRVDGELSVMKHEVEVLNHYSAIFPTQRYWTVREAAYLYQDLQAMRHKIHHWETDAASPKDAIGRIEQFYTKLVWRIDKLLQTQEETVKRFKSEGMPWDNIYVQRVQHDALKLVTLHMDYTLQEVANLESQLPPCPELTDKCFSLLSNAAHFAVKGHQFAGGLNPNASTKFQELAAVARKYKDLKLREQQAA